MQSAAIQSTYTRNYTIVNVRHIMPTYTCMYNTTKLILFGSHVKYSITISLPLYRTSSVAKMAPEKLRCKREGARSSQEFASTLSECYSYRYTAAVLAQCVMSFIVMGTVPETTFYIHVATID